MFFRKLRKQIKNLTLRIVRLESEASQTRILDDSFNRMKYEDVCKLYDMDPYSYSCIKFSVLPSELWEYVRKYFISAGADEKDRKEARFSAKIINADTKETKSIEISKSWIDLDSKEPKARPAEHIDTDAAVDYNRNKLDSIDNKLDTLIDLFTRNKINVTSDVIDNLTDDELDNFADRVNKEHEEEK